MHIKYLFLALIISSFFTHAHGMQNYEQNNTDYNVSCIHQWAPEDVWLQIIARSDAKDTIRKTCSYFRKCASTRNEKLFLQNPLIIVPEVLERFTLYYADFANNEILNNLLQHGADPNSADDKDKSLMHYAVQNGNLEMVKRLLEHPDFYTSNMATNEYSPLLLAAQCKHTKIVEHILSQCTIDYNAMLCLAIHYELSDFTKLLLPHMSHNNTLINTETMSPPEKDTRYHKRRKISALHYAAIKGDADTAQVLISNGMHVDTADTDNCTPFHYAISHNVTNMIKLFMNNKANINNVCNAGETSLHHAVRSGLMTKALFLLNHGANINTKDANGDTALFTSSAAGHTHVVKLLLAYNADINERDRDGATALSQAFYNHQLTIMHLLLSQPDIDTTQPWKDKQTLLHRIIDNQYNHDLYKEIIDLALQKTDINALDVYGNSPLSYTYWHKDIPMLQKLLEQPTIKINALHGQNLSNEFKENAIDGYGYKRKGPVTVLDLALQHQNQNTEMIDLLIQHGAKTKTQLEEDGLIENI